VTTIAEFIAARLEERWAQAHRNVVAAESFAATYGGTNETAAAIVRIRDAYRPLRMIDAQRRTLKRHTGCGSGIGYCDDGGHAWDFPDPPGCPDLADLAAPDEDHPDFNPAWKIEETS